MGHFEMTHRMAGLFMHIQRLMAGGAQDEEDVRNLFLVMSDSEKEKAFELGRLIRRDKNLCRILSEGRRGRETNKNGSMATLRTDRDT